MDDKTLNDFKVKMENSLKVYGDELSRLRTGIASPSLLEPVIVDAYNGKMKIS